MSELRNFATHDDCLTICMTEPLRVDTSVNIFVFERLCDISGRPSLPLRSVHNIVMVAFMTLAEYSYLFQAMSCWLQSQCNVVLELSYTSVHPNILTPR